MSGPGILTAEPHRSRFRELVHGAIGNQSAHSLVLGGSLVMLIGTILVSVINFGYNVAMARMLGPAAFGHAAVAVTLMMVASCVTLSFQMVCAKFVARNPTAGARAEVFRQLHRKAWMVGLVLAAALFALQEPISQFLRLPDRTLVVLLALGIAFYVPLGVRRGGLQGVCEFPRLSANFVLEAIVKLAAAVLLVRLGYGVMGAVGAISVSIAVAYFLPTLGRRVGTGSDVCVPASFKEGMQAIVFFVGQVIISNIDMLLVKHFFPPDQAGHYASVALVGRVVFFASWSVVSAMFPVSAAAEPEERNHSVLLVPLGIVLAISVAAVVVLSVFPELIVRYIFGHEFQEAVPLLSLYATATGLYSLSVVLIAYEMSRRIANTGWLQLAFSGALVLAISQFHGSLRQVVMVQIITMAALLVAVSVPFFRSYRSSRIAEEAA